MLTPPQCCLAFRMPVRRRNDATIRSGCTLRIHVDGLRNSTGVVGSIIFQVRAMAGRKIQDKSFRHGPTPIAPGQRQATVVWEHLPPGDYGVAVIHDENQQCQARSQLHRNSQGRLRIRQQSACGLVSAAVRGRDRARAVSFHRHRNSPAIQMSVNYFFSPAENFVQGPDGMSLRTGFR